MNTLDSNPTFSEFTVGWELDTGRELQYCMSYVMVEEVQGATGAPKRGT